MDVWNIAVVTDSPRNGPPVATLFAVEALSQSVAEQAVRDQVGVPIHSITSHSLAPHIALAFQMKPGEVRRLP
jgi:hypothetical protein